MTFPNTPISTANIDSDTDSVSLARADIKSAVDTVNSIIDEFQIEGADVNQTIQYDGTKWAPAILSGSSVNWAMVTSVFSSPSINTSLFTNSNISISSGTIQLAAGSYIMVLTGGVRRETSNGIPSYTISDGTTNVFTETGVTVGTVNNDWRFLRASKIATYTCSSIATLTPSVSGTDCGTQLRIVPIG